MPKLNKYLAATYCLFILQRSAAQETLTDSAIAMRAQQQVVQLYLDSVKEHLHLYNGFEFTSGYRGSAGHPFFESAEPAPGSVLYDGVQYPGIRLLFDLTRDELIFVTPANNLNIKLIPQKVGGFTLQGRQFVYIGEETNDQGIRGFYELASDGPYPVFVKRKKDIYESREENSSRFVQSSTYYVRKDGEYRSIDSKRALLSVCKDRKPDVAKFIKEHNLDFKRDPVNTIVKVMAYYSQLKA